MPHLGQQFASLLNKAIEEHGRGTILEALAFAIHGSLVDDIENGWDIKTICNKLRKTMQKSENKHSLDLMAFKSDESP